MAFGIDLEEPSLAEKLGGKIDPQDQFDEELSGAVQRGCYSAPQFIDDLFGGRLTAKNVRNALTGVCITQQWKPDLAPSHLATMLMKDRRDYASIDNTVLTIIGLKAHPAPTSPHH